MTTPPRPDITPFQSTPSARRATQRGRHHRQAEPISIHALREEGDFQSQPVRKSAVYFNPRPPRGGRHKGGLRTQLHLTISIHALREEGDSSYKDSSIHTYLFQSTPSARRATPEAQCCCTNRRIFQSTPSARRATCHCRPSCRPIRNFNPRPPRGGRLLTQIFANI